jgi:hypothetical protein
MKPSYLVVALSLYTKYFLLFLFLMGKNHIYYFVAPGIRDGADLFYYLWLLLSLPTLEVLCFSAPLYWALTARNRRLAAAITLGSVVLGAVCYHYLASTMDPSNGVILALIGGVVQGLLFFKTRRPQAA